MFKFLDKFLNSITMYRLMMYGLCIEAGLAIVFAAFGWISYAPLQMVMSLAILIAVSAGANKLFGKLTRAAVNAESVYITAFLLFFILDPRVTSFLSVGLLALAAVIAQASKYLFAIGRKHVFNPVAISAILLDLLGVSILMWWVATPIMLPFVLVFGLMVARKIRGLQAVGAFAISAMLVGALNGIPLSSLFLSWPLVFFGTMMLTEPRTAPAMKRD